MPYMASNSNGKFTMTQNPLLLTLNLYKIVPSICCRLVILPNRTIVLFIGEKSPSSFIFIVWTVCQTHLSHLQSS